MHLADHLKTVRKLEDQLMSLHGFIWQALGPNTKAALECHPMMNVYDLKEPKSDTVHHLLKAIFLVCTSPEGITEEQRVIDAMHSLVTSEMETPSDLEAFFRKVESRAESLSDCGLEVGEKEMVVVATRGLNGPFARHKDVLMQAANVSGNGLPTSLAALRAAIVRIDNTSNETSAFSVQTGRGAKQPGKGSSGGGGGGSTLEQKEKLIENLKSEKERMKKQLSAKDKVIADLREEISELKKKSAKPDGRGSEDDRRKDDRGGRDRRPSKREEGGRDRPGKKARFQPDPEKGNQRQLPAGSGGKNVPIKANSARDGYSDSDSGSEDSD